MNLTEYLKADIPGAELLLDPTKAKLSTFPFTIGSNEIIFYGIPILLYVKCPLLQVLPIEELTKDPKLGTNIELTDENLPGLVYIWLYMNGLVLLPHIDSSMEALGPYSVLDLLIMLEWVDYFGTQDIDEDINSELYSRIARGEQLVSDAKILLEKRYALGKMSFHDKVKVAFYLGKDPSEFEQKMSYESDDDRALGNDIAYKLERRIINDKLTDNDRRWIKFLKNELLRYNFPEENIKKFLLTVDELK